MRQTERLTLICNSHLNEGDVLVRIAVFLFLPKLKTYGAPGNKCPRTTFDSETLFELRKENDTGADLRAHVFCNDLGY